MGAHGPFCLWSPESLETPLPALKSKTLHMIGQFFNDDYKFSVFTIFASLSVMCYRLPDSFVFLSLFNL